MSGNRQSRNICRSVLFFQVDAINNGSSQSSREFEVIITHKIHRAAWKWFKREGRYMTQQIIMLCYPRKCYKRCCRWIYFAEIKMSLSSNEYHFKTKRTFNPSSVFCHGWYGYSYVCWLSMYLCISTNVIL